VVLKRVPLGSLREDFLIPGMNFVRDRNWGGKAVAEKAYAFIICLFNTKKLRNESDQLGMLTRTGYFNCSD